MNIRSAAFALLWLVSLTACVPMRQLEVAPDSAIKPFYEGGDLMLRSTQRYDVVVRVVTKSFTDRTADFPALLVAVKNPTDASVDFSAANITAHSGKKTVKVYSFESYRRKVRVESVFNMIDAVSGSVQGGVAGAVKSNQASGELSDLASALHNNGAMLTTHTIAPGQFAGGVVRLNAPAIDSGKPLAMQVNIAGEVHEFRFSVHR